MSCKARVLAVLLLSLACAWSAEAADVDEGSEIPLTVFTRAYGGPSAGDTCKVVSRSVLAVNEFKLVRALEFLRADDEIGIGDMIAEKTADYVAEGELLKVIRRHERPLFSAPLSPHPLEVRVVTGPYKGQLVWVSEAVVARKMFLLLTEFYAKTASGARTRVTVPDELRVDAYTERSRRRGLSQEQIAGDAKDILNAARQAEKDRQFNRAVPRYFALAQMYRELPEGKEGYNWLLARRWGLEPDGVPSIMKLDTDQQEDPKLVVREEPAQPEAGAKTKRAQRKDPLSAGSTVIVRDKKAGKVKARDGNGYQDFYDLENGTKALVIQNPRNMAVKLKVLDGKEKGRTVVVPVKSIEPLTKDDDAAGVSSQGK